MGIEFVQFLGPLGGLLCIAWAMGAIAGYAFHSKMVLPLHQKIYDEKVRALEQDRTDLTARVATLEGEISLLKIAEKQRRRRTQRDRTSQ